MQATDKENPLQKTLDYCLKRLQRETKESNRIALEGAVKQIKKELGLDKINTLD